MRSAHSLEGAGAQSFRLVSIGKGLLLGLESQFAPGRHRAEVFPEGTFEELSWRLKPTESGETQYK